MSSRAEAWKYAERTPKKVLGCFRAGCWTSSGKNLKFNGVF